MSELISDFKLNFSYKDLRKLKPEVRKLKDETAIKALVQPIYKSVLDRAERKLHLGVFGATDSGNFYRSPGCEFIVDNIEVNVRGNKECLGGEYQSDVSGSDSSNLYFGVTSISVQSTRKVPVEKVYEGIKFIAEKEFSDLSYLITEAMKEQPRISRAMIKALL